MKIALIGSKGQLGTELSRKISKKNIDCCFFSHQDADITNLSNVRSIMKEIRPDVVINCAAFNSVDDAEENWKNAHAVNALGPRNLALVCNDIGSTLVHFSTHFVFDGHQKRPYRISDPTGPLNSYGISKLFGERMVTSLTNNFFIIRVSWLFGHYGISKFNFAERLIRLSQKSEKITIVDDQISAPAFTEDVARATLEIIESGEFGLYHLSNTGECSKYEWAKYLLEGITWNGDLIPAKTCDFPDQVPRPLYSTLDNFPAEQVIGYQLPDWKNASLRFLNRLPDISVTEKKEGDC